jgi:hypothetical protein
MKRAIGVMAVLAALTIVGAVTEEEWVLTGNGCPVGTDRWDTIGSDFAGDEAGFATKADAVRARLREGNLDASNGSIRRAIAQRERGIESDTPAVVETSEGLPAVLTLEIFNGGWFVTDASWCRRRGG